MFGGIRCLGALSFIHRLVHSDTKVLFQEKEWLFAHGPTLVTVPNVASRYR